MAEVESIGLTSVQSYLRGLAERIDRGEEVDYAFVQILPNGDIQEAYSLGGLSTNAKHLIYTLDSVSLKMRLIDMEEF